MDVEHVRDEVKNIAECVGDPEVAHTFEDKLYLEILTAISKSNSEYADICREAIKSQNLDFPRWCA